MSRVFEIEDFGEAFLLTGLSCPIARCKISSQRLVDGKMVASAEASQDFVDFWVDRINPGY